MKIKNIKWVEDKDLINPFQRVSEVAGPKYTAPTIFQFKYYRQPNK